MPSTVATEPTFSTGKEELKQEVNALDAMIDEFTQSEAAKAELESRIEAIHAEKEQFRSDVQSSYKKISDVIGLDLAEQITSEDQGDIPLHLYSDKMEKVYAHPFFGPHIKTLLEG